MKKEIIKSVENKSCRWYENLTYKEAKERIRNSLQNIACDYVALGYYLRFVQAGELAQGRKNLLFAGGQQEEGSALDEF